MSENMTAAVAANSNGATFFGHPRGLVTLFFTEMWERFSYYGMRALLVLFLVDAIEHHGFGLTDRTATAIYGLYTAGVYLTSLPGGWIADRLLGSQRAVWWGALVIMLGHTLLGLAVTPATFYLGLVVVACGTGLLKPNIGAIVAELYPEGGGRRDAGYTIYYFSVNLGATIGQIVTAWLATRISWSAGFFAAAVGMALGLLQFALLRKHLGVAGVEPYRSANNAALPILARRAWIAAVVAGVVIALILFGAIPFDPLTVAHYSAGVIIALAAAVFLYLLGFAGLDGLGRKRIAVIVVLFAASAVFWAGFEQAGSSFNLFADRYTNRVVETIQFEIPAGWFQSVNTFLILFCAPLFAALWQWLSDRNRDWSAATKMALGLLLLGAGFVVMSGAARNVATGAKVAPTWLVATYLLHTFGELCLSPVGQSAFSKLVPQRLVGQIMGLWFLSISLGSLLAGLIAGTFDSQNLNAMSGQYLNIVWLVVIPGIVLILLARPLKKLAGGVN